MSQRTPPTTRLHTAAEWCRSPDPLTRIQGLELAAGLGREGREMVLRALADNELLVREAAIRLAVRVLPAPRLLTGLASRENATLRTSCISALRQQGSRALPALRRELRSRDPDVVMFCLQILGSMPGEEAAALLLPYLSHENLNLAQAAVDSLGELKSTVAVGPLLELLCGDPWLAFAATLALGRIGDPRATRDLLALLDDDVLRAVALEALERIADGAAARPICKRLAAEESPRERDALLRTLGACLRNAGGGAVARTDPEVAGLLDREGFAQYLREALRSEDASLLAASNCVVRAFSVQRLYPDLIEHLDQEPYDGPTCPFFVSLPEAEGVEAILRTAVSHQRIGVRSTAMRILGARREPWGEPLILDRLDDAEPRVVADAIRALARRSPPGAFDRILPFLHHPEEAVASRALEALQATARQEGFDRLAGLIASAPAGAAELIDYVELSRRLGDARFVPAWLSRLAGAPADLLRSLLRALGSTRDPRLSEPLLEYLEHPALPIRILAIEALGHPGNAGIGPELHRRLLTDRGCTYHLVRALGRMRHRPAADDLIGIYAGASSLEKIAIIEALGAMETLAAERFLKTELESFDRERQRAAAMALARHFRAGNLALFLKLARSQDWSLRNTAAWALGETGGEAARAALNELSGDRQEVVARTARTFLGRWR
ncbi:MAG: HEAT repeat domain-containing protein [Holophagales bacterium]|nr:HEAT repeat domain-containing protein [Holophagales bacterium]